MVRELYENDVMDTPTKKQCCTNIKDNLLAADDTSVCRQTVTRPSASDMERASPYTKTKYTPSNNNIPNITGGGPAGPEDTEISRESLVYVPWVGSAA